MSIPLPRESKAVQSIMDDNESLLTLEELNDFLRKNGFSDKGFAEFLGVTIQAVRAWRREQRLISMTTTKVVRLMIKFPHLLQEF